MRPSLAEQLAEAATAVRLGAVPPTTRHQLARLLLDFVGDVTLSAPHDFADACVRAAARMGSQPDCAVIGRRERLAAPSVALVHGTFAHGLEFDDSHLPSLSHLTATVVPVVLAVGELLGLDGTKMLTANLVGVEVGGRLGRAVTAPGWGGSAVRARGFFSTSVFGTVAAAVAAAHALDLPRPRVAYAISLACNAACGLAEVASGDSWAKRSQPGWAAHAGLSAALLAGEGYDGPRAALEGERGFFNGFAGGHARPEALTDGWGGRWEVDEVSIKSYPVEHYLQTILELIEQCRAEIRLDRSQVTEIEVGLPGQIRKAIFEPREFKNAPPDSYTARYSAPYCLARALTKVESPRLEREDFHERFVHDDALRAVAARIRFVPDPAFDAVFPEHAPGRLRLHAGAQCLWEGQLDDVYGSPFRPMTDADLIAKFHGNCAAWSEPKRARLLGVVMDLERRHARDLVAAL
jgi:2-methylcitrate dehydratase PrpD